MHDFRKLRVWQQSRQFAVDIDQLTRKFPRSDRGVIASQLRRAAISIPSNIAEGCGKSSRKETIRFLQIAAGSATETENHLLIASDLRYIAPPIREARLDDVKSIQRMLTSLIAKLPP